MSSLEDLLNDLANLDAQHDLDGLRGLRQKIIDEHPETDAAVEAQYKLGLDFLFRQRDVQAAVASFSAAAKLKHPYWSAAARTSLGLCYYHQQKMQKALFELRRVGYPEHPSVHSVTALTFLENIMVEEGNLDEVPRVRKERVNQLRKLISDNETKGGETGERGFHLFQLGVALADSGDEAGSKEALERAKALGEKTLGPDLYRNVLDALS